MFSHHCTMTHKCFMRIHQVHCGRLCNLTWLVLRKRMRGILRSRYALILIMLSIASAVVHLWSVPESPQRFTKPEIGPRPLFDLHYISINILFVSCCAVIHLMWNVCRSLGRLGTAGLDDLLLLLPLLQVTRVQASQWHQGGLHGCANYIWKP